MPIALRALLLAVLVAVIPSADAFPLIWSKSLAGASQSKVIQDPASNLYVASRAPTPTGRRIMVQKYNAVGTLLWQYSADEMGSSDTQYSIRSIAVSPMRVVVLIQDRLQSGEGEFLGSKMLILNSMNGQFVELKNSPLQLEHVGYGGGNVRRFAVQRYSRETSQVSVEFFGMEMTSFGVKPVGPGAAFVLRNGVEIPLLSTGLLVDGAGNAYVGYYGGAGGRSAVIAKVNFVNVFWLTEVPMDLNGVTDPYQDEFVSHLAFDPTTNTVYALAKGFRSASPNDSDVFSCTMNASTGATISCQQFVSDNQGVDDLPAAMTVVAGIGAFASVFQGETGRTLTRRFGPDGQTVWERILTSPGRVFRHADDGAGNLIRLTSDDPRSLRIGKLAVDSGIQLLAIFEQGPGDVFPKGILSDPAGNVYLNYDFPTSSNLARLQFARLNFAANLVSGGATLEAEIELSSNAVEAEVWVLRSSNPAVVSVPTSVSIARFA